MSRVLAWFSCGAASAVAAKLAVEKYGDRCEVLYCDTLAYEHPDNRRFMADVSKWLGKPIKLLHSKEYVDIMDVFRRERWLVGPLGARCTVEMKKVPRHEYQRPDDIQVFGFTSEERARAERFTAENWEVKGEFPLLDQGVTKEECYRRLVSAGIELPAMYRMGYRNNNCIGCVKGGMGYWNKIRRDFPEDFARMAGVERELGATILSDRRGGKRVRVYLDELDPASGRYIEEPSIECGVICELTAPPLARDNRSHSNFRGTLMTTPTSVSVRFMRKVSPEQYGAMEAEVSFGTGVLDDRSPGSVAEELLHTASVLVLTKLGLTPPPATAVTLGTVEPSAPTPRRPGRPPKDKPVEPSPQPVSATVETKPEAATGKPAPDPVADAEATKIEQLAAAGQVEGADEFADPPAAKDIDDKTLQEECGKAAKVIGSDRVKSLFQTKYGAPRVSSLKPGERQAFLDDLAVQVAQKQAAA